jgi:hypothetical protein
VALCSVAATVGAAYFVVFHYIPVWGSSGWFLEKIVWPCGLVELKQGFAKAELSQGKISNFSGNLRNSCGDRCKTTEFRRIEAYLIDPINN